MTKGIHGQCLVVDLLTFKVVGKGRHFLYQKWNCGHGEQILSLHYLDLLQSVALTIYPPVQLTSILELR